MNRLELIWTHLRSSFWFLPMLIYASSIVIAVALIEADAGSARALIDNWPRLFGSGAAGARGMLSTIAGSMMTVVGVTFSMTLVTLALASSQYTSRILRNFMSDRLTQVVLGIFGGIFIYCLIVLRTIRGGEEDYVPSLAVLFGVMFAIGGISMLIFFIHHIASSIQASSIIESVTQETLAAIDRLLPSENHGGVRAPEARAEGATALHAGPRQKLTATRIGYIQSIDVATALRLAAEHEAIVRLELGVGEFVVTGTELASITSQAPMPEDAINGLAKAFNIYRFRTVDQDPGFGVRQIVDIALRALSPSVNDTTTAAMCVDYLSAILAHVVDREFPPCVHRHEGIDRVISVEQTFAGLLAGAFDQIRSCARGNLHIVGKMLEALQRLAARARDEQRQKRLAEYLDCMMDLRDSLGSVYEREQFDAMLHGARGVLRL